MGALLALASALFYGLADFAGGLVSRRVSPAATALAGQVGGLALALALVPAVPAAPGSTGAPADLGWGALSGVGTGIGMLFLFRGLSRGAMSVVVPVSAVGGVALPVLVGVAVLGDRPPVLSWIGIAVTVPALWLVSRTGGEAEGTDGAADRAALDGLIAGAGIALQYVALAQAGPGAGLWPVVAGRVAAALTILPWAVRTSPRPPVRQATAAAGTGVLAASALVCYMLAAREELLVVAVVLSSFYPAIPVVLGITVLRERLAPPQALGLLGAAAAIGLLTLG